MSDDDQANIEDRFRAMEIEEEIAEMRGGGGSRPRSKRATDDDLADMKAALDGDEPLERYVLAICPHCQGKNRISLTRLRGGDPRCGHCKDALSFTKR